jgi:hypothetical protein
MPFNADLNPKGSKSMDLLEMVKMEDYLERRRALSTPRPAVKPAAKTATPAADAVLAKPIPNNMLKSSADDLGTEFRFNSKQHANDNMG